jgi:hypothetical protein
VTGRRLGLAFALGEHGHEPAESDEPLREDEILELVKETFDARELDREES